MNKVEMRCTSCKSTNVGKDAFAAWDMETQKWVLASLFDSNTCHDCGKETRLEEVQIHEF